MTQSRTGTPVFLQTLRVARLAPDGSTPAGASNAYVTDVGVNLTFAPQVREGVEKVKLNGRGDPCFTAKRPPTIDRYNVELEICGVDPELRELLSGGTLITAAGDTIGAQVPALGSVPVPNGVSIEGWASYLDAGGGELPGGPFYFKTAAPKVFLVPGTLAFGEDPTSSTFTGYAVENTAWGNGPFNDWLYASGRAVQHYVTNSKPAAQLGYVTVPAQTV